jgi:hypothetical protein
MNIISKTHKRFSDRLRNPSFSDRLRNRRVLECPEEFLGENYEAVLNFWSILDELSVEQLKVVDERQWAFYNENFSEWRKATVLVWPTAEKVVAWQYAYDANWAAYNVTNSVAARFATSELIGKHKILENHQQPLTFFQMFLEVL